MPDPTVDTQTKVLDRITMAAPAGVWSRADFLDIASPNGVEKALQRLAAQGAIRRVHRGLYDQPRRSKLTGKLVFPPRASFVDAIARRDKLRIIVDGMTAANDLGLTTAVPALSTVHADTYPRLIEINATAGDPSSPKPVLYKLDFKRIAAKTAFWAGRPAMRVIQALDWFKDTNGDEVVLVNGITNYLSRSPRRLEILDDLRQNKNAASAWMFPLIDAIIKNAISESDHAQAIS